MSILTADQISEQGSSTITRGIWFGARERPALGWLSSPTHGIADSGVVIAPPTGYPYWCSHRTLRSLAERLAAAGHAVLRIDYDGTGDSAGDQWDADRVDAWRRTVALAVEELRRLGAEHLTLVGARIGGTFALLDGQELGVDRVLAWMPVTAGRRYAKELRLLSEAVPEGLDPLDPPGTRLVAGNVFSVQTLRDLQALAVTDVEQPPAAATLILDDPGGSAVKAVAHLRSIGAAVEHLQLDGGENALETPPEFATVPEEILAAACNWIGAGTATPAEAPAQLRTRATLEWHGRRIEEEVITLGPRGHVGVLTSPERLDPDATTLVLLNPGSETHIGPGRAWVEYARDLTATGRRTVRVDFLGWGESPDAGRTPGRPYDAACVQDTVAIVEELRSAGHERIAICGLCASAWIALAAARRAAVDGVIAINPQLYWKPGDPAEIDWDLIRSRRAPEIKRIERGARLGLWTLLDWLGRLPPAASWLDDLAARRMGIHLIFAEGDDGLVYLHQRLGRHLRRLRGINVHELPEVDHPMHLTWLRPRVVTALAGALTAIDGVR